MPQSEKNKLYKTVQDVSRAQLCCGCGTCVISCPKSIVTIVESPCGLLEAKVDVDACNNCEICVKVCPGIGIDKELLPEAYDLFVGPVMQAYIGHAVNSKTRGNGQSGGVTTALLVNLLENGIIDRAIVSVMPNDGSLRPVPILTNDPDVILSSAGSKYCPIPVNIVLDQVKPKEKIAMVGLPCHFHGLTKYQHVFKKNLNILKIGLICDRVLSYHAIEYMTVKSGVPLKDTSFFRYRDKGIKGWPGDICVTDITGKKHFVDKSIRMNCKDYFTPYRCRLCFDKMNILSDIVVGDPHGISKDKEEYTVCIARSEKGEMIFNSAISKDISLQPLEPDNIINGQKVDVKKYDYNAYLTIAIKKNFPYPNPISYKVTQSIEHMELLNRSYTMISETNKNKFIKKTSKIISYKEIRKKFSPNNLLHRIKQVVYK